MYDLVRDSFFGRLLRITTRGQFPKYPEELAGFEVPEIYRFSAPQETTTTSLKAPSNLGDAASDDAASEEEKDLEKPEVVDVVNNGEEKEELYPPISRLATSLHGNASSGQLGFEDEEKDIEKLEQQLPDVHKTMSGFTVVTWYSDTDQENPHNWSNRKKLWTGLIVLLYTLAIYIAASLYTASIPTMMEMWNLSRIGASVGLSIYVIGYGLGPLIMSPLSEIPWIGRNPPFLIGFFFFVVLCVPIALVDNYAGMLVLRFLLGVAGSPALAAGGASYGDFCTGELPNYLVLNHY